MSNIQRKIGFKGKIINIDPVGYIRDQVFLRLGVYDASDIQEGEYKPLSVSDFELQESVALTLGGSPYTSGNGTEEVIDKYDIKVLSILYDGFVVESYGRFIKITVEEVLAI